jgi:hypothetical protein
MKGNDILCWSLPSPYIADLSSHHFLQSDHLKEENDIQTQENCVMSFFNVKYTDNSNLHTHTYAAYTI